MFSLFDTSRELAGYELTHDGERWMLLEEIQNDCFYAIKVDDPHPRQVYFVHVAWDENQKEQAIAASLKRGD